MRVFRDDMGSRCAFARAPMSSPTLAFRDQTQKGRVDPLNSQVARVGYLSRGPRVPSNANEGKMQFSCFAEALVRRGVNHVSFDCLCFANNFLKNYHR